MGARIIASEGPASTRRLSIGVSPMVRKVLPGFKISRAVRLGDWLFSNGQMDIGAEAKVCNPNDIVAQTVTCMRSVYEVVAKADCRLAELAQVQVFYLGGSIKDEAAYREQILEEFPECRDTLLVLTRVPSFATVGHEVEIDAIAVKGSRSAVANETGVVQGVRRGDWVFANSRESRGAKDVSERLRATLVALDCALADVCRLYVYCASDLSAGEREQIERDIAEAFRGAPPAYHATLLPQTSKSEFMVELEVIANSNPALERVRHGRAASPRPGLDWPFVAALRCGEAVFASGQFALNEAGEMLHPAEIASQARVVMRRLGDALNGAGAQLSDLVKIKTYFKGAWDLENWFENLRARMESLSDPGPASTGIEGLPPVMADALLSVDGIAILDCERRAS